MIKNRVKQFFLFIFCSHITKNDITYIDSILNEYEKNLFYKLYKSEQKHSIRVSRACANYKEINKFKNFNINKDRLVKAALLHDVGKSIQKANIFNKSILVIINHSSNNNLIKFLKNYFNNKYNVFLNHPEIGYNLFKGIETDEKLLFLIKNHENNNINNDELTVLSYFDEIN